MKFLNLLFLLVFAFPIQINASNTNKKIDDFLKIPAPYGESSISECQQSDGSLPFTLADLPVYNTQGYTEIFWFADPFQNIALPANTNTEDGGVYYAFQAIGGNAAYLEVQVIMIPYMPAPTGDSDQYFTDGCTMTLADAAVFNTTGYDSMYWYNECIGCGSVEDPIDPNTVLQDGDVFYAVQGDNGCCPGCLEVTFHAIPPIPAPIGDSDQYFTEGTYFTLSDAAVYNTTGFSYIYWYADAAEQETGVSCSTIVEDGDVYYAFQGIICGDCQCSLYLEVTFHMIPLGVAENKESFFKLYPSPVKDILTISLEKQIKNLSLRITDNNGKLVYNESVHSLEDDLKIDVSKFDTGMYILTLWADGKVQTNKFIIE